MRHLSLLACSLLLWGWDAKAATEAELASDHEQVVQRWGVTWFSPVELGVLGTTAQSNPSTQGVTIAKNETRNVIPVGVRRWLSPTTGIDVGVGLTWGGRETTASNGNVLVTTTAPAVFGFSLHGGFPVALNQGRHHTVLFIPELDLGYATSSWAEDKGDGSNGKRDVSSSGFHLGIGTRLGCELQFGFLGVPELSVQGSVGLAFRYDRASVTKGGADTATVTTDSGSGLSTATYHQPWDIFQGKVAAIYYF